MKPKPIIHFAHANGFPATTYQTFFDYLKKRFDIGYIDLHGHNPNYPVSDNWDYLIQELIDHIQAHYDSPIIGVGHSMGGALHYFASQHRPDLYEQVLMIDTPLFNQWKSRMLGFAKRFGFVDRVTPARRTKFRRNHWPDFESAKKYLQGKALYKNFDERALNDFLIYGMQQSNQEVSLKFNPRIEYEIFKTLPHKIPKNKGEVPVHLVYANKSEVLTARDLASLQKRHRIAIHEAEGSHMLPFEKPEFLAELLITILLKE